MSIYLLPNTLAAKADDYELHSSYSDAESDFTLEDLLWGPRSHVVQSDNTDDVLQFRLEDSTEETSIDYMVITRADWLKNHQETVRVNPGYYGAASYGSETLEGVQAMGGQTLIGPKAQDYIYTGWAGGQSGYGFTAKIDNSGANTCRYQCSNVVFSSRFDFEQQPDIRAPQVTQISEDEQIYAPAANPAVAYAVEKQFVLIWSAITDAKAEAFLDLPHLLTWPMFIYDENADVFPWKLEHCILQRYEITRNGYDYNTITGTFLRLKHYE